MAAGHPIRASPKSRSQLSKIEAGEHHPQMLRANPHFPAEARQLLRHSGCGLVAMK
jgi:hypothetical protein